MKLRLLILLSFCVCLTAPLVGQNSSKIRDPKKSTPDERALWAQALHVMEKHPLNEQVQAVAAESANRLHEVDDVAISPCGIFAELPVKWNKSWGVVIYLLGLSAYQTETNKDDAIGENLYATRSVLKAYQAAILQDPKLRDKKLDALSKMDSDGTLAAFVAKKGC